MITEIVKILIICLITSFLSIILKPKSAEYALGLTMMAGVLVMIWIVRNISAPIKEISDRLSEYGVKTEYFKIALKAVGLAYITDFIADACRDSGQASMAAKAELAGKVAIFVLSVPLFISVLETAVGFIK